MKTYRWQIVCMWIGWVLLGTTVCVLPFVMLRSCFSFHMVVYTSFLAMACAFLGKKSTALCWLSTIVFVAALLGLTMLGLIQDRVYYVTQDLGDAIASRDLKLIKRKINDGYSPNGWSKDGRTMLTMACTLGYPRDETPLEEKARIEYETLSLLLENGASKSVNMLDAFHGKAPIHYVCTDGYGSAEYQLRILRLLINYGADVNIRDRDGRAPLHLVACYGTYPEVASLLLENGADMNALDSEGRTPLQLAVLCDQQDIAKLLYTHEPNIGSPIEKNPR